MKRFVAIFRKTVLAVIIISGLLSISVKAAAQNKVYEPQMRQWAAEDSLIPPAKDIILFTGSSSFTYWKTVQQDFPEYPILNRGFGGSTLGDLIHFANDAILKYQPRQIVIYCGENDLGTDKNNTADTVINRFKRLFKMIRSKFPKAKVSYVSMKPSPSREHLMPAFEQANNAIRKFLKKKKNTSFIDTYHAMLLPNGKPMPDIFVDDKLHMNRKGYEIWQRIIQPHLLKTSK